MKRYSALILLLVLTLSLTACSAVYISRADDISNYITEEDGHHALILPQSKNSIYIDEDDVDLLSDVDINLLKTAEKTILNQVEQYPNEPYFYLETSDDMHLCLCAEVIVDIDPAHAPSSGCEDHEHKFFKEQITK